MKYFLFPLGMALFLFACALPENIQDGQTAWQLKKYSLAAELLQKDYRKNNPETDQAELAFQIARSYEFTNEIDEAATWYQTAIEDGYGAEAIWRYALMLKRQEKYQSAIQQFNNYLAEEPYRKPEITVEINACEQALRWIQRQDDEFERDTYVNALPGLNSAQTDFLLTPIDAQTWIFTSSRSGSTGEQTDSWTNQSFYDAYQTTSPYPGKFQDVTNFEGFINTPYNDGAVIFNQERTEMFFTRCGSDNRKVDDYCGIYVSYLQNDNVWSEPVLLNFFEDSLNTGAPCLSPDNQFLFFTATDPNGAGGSDIFYAKRLFEGWDEPQNAGSSVNTTGNEAFPSFGPDGTFYFASDGIPGMGGLDIYSAIWKNGKFSKVSNMEYPINSGGDDFGLFIDSRKTAEDTLQIGYFTSSRKGGMGSDDLYVFIKKEKTPRPPVYVLTGRVLRKVYEDSNDVTSTVMDTIPLYGASVAISEPGSVSLTGKFTLTEKNETFSLEVQIPKVYDLKGNMEGFFSKTIQVTTEKWQADPGDTLIVYQEIVLDQIPTGKETEIKLSNIYYDFNDTTLRPESFPELDQLVKLLTENPNLTIQINSHTDSRGNDKYNQKLSQGRANSVVQYLISKGIVAERLMAKGFGESDPDIVRLAVQTPSGITIERGTELKEAFINQFKSNKDDFEYLHQFNRRTTFTVLSDDFTLDSETPTDIEVDPAPDDEIRDPNPKLD